jgi:soluble P-type ATPase
MIIDIPGYKTLDLRNVVLDFNGTLANSGLLIEGVAEWIDKISEHFNIYVITADTFGTVRKQLEDVNCQLTIIPIENQSEAKLEFARSLDLKHTICIGNGRNDRLMLKEAILGIAVLEDEGACTETLFASNMVCKSIINAFQIISNPNKLIAGLRS